MLLWDGGVLCKVCAGVVNEGNDRIELTWSGGISEHAVVAVPRVCVSERVAEVDGGRR